MTAHARPAPPKRPPLLPRGTPLERGQLAVLAVLVVLTLGAWALTVHQARTMGMPMGVVARGGGAVPDPAPAPDGMPGMPGMDAMPGMAGAGDAPGDGAGGMAGPGWSPGGFAAFVAAWAAMMAAMMFPAAAPMLLLFHAVSARRRAGGGASVPTWVFAAGYLLVWTAVGAVAWVLVRLGSELAGRLGAGERAAWGPVALGGVLVVAGLYQLTPLKRVCLDRCRTPAAFVMQHWRDGRRGALRMGVVHGAYCLGCCWALFAVLVAAGVMSLAWMLLLTLVVFAEKALPAGGRTARVVGAALLLLGVLVAGGATGMPWTA